jgi:hypothetical protein
MIMVFPLAQFRTGYEVLEKILNVTIMCEKTNDKCLEQLRVQVSKLTAIDACAYELEELYMTLREIDAVDPFPRIMPQWLALMCIVSDYISHEDVVALTATFLEIRALMETAERSMEFFGPMSTASYDPADEREWDTDSF